jgi:Protein of unknown function (DUF1353)
MSNGHFSTPEVLVRTGDGHNFILWESFSFFRPSGEEVKFNRLGWTDGASTPAFIWSKFPPFGPYWKDAFGHDLLYRYSQRPKDECDLIFKEMMEADGVDKATIFILYNAVKDFGQSSFDQDRKQQTGQNNETTT